jgi:hypothetical protein
MEDAATWGEFLLFHFTEHNSLKFAHTVRVRIGRHHKELDSVVIYPRQDWWHKKRSFLSYQPEDTYKFGQQMGKKLQENMQTNMKYKYTKKKSITDAIFEGSTMLKLSTYIKIHIWI